MRNFLSLAAGALMATVGFVRDLSQGAGLADDALGKVNLALGHIPESALPVLTFSRGGYTIRRGKGSRAHRRWATARASGRHDFRRTLAKG